jgi:hypothetical protein
MYNGKAAEAELKTLAELSGGQHMDHDLIRHNLVVFRGGENALQVRGGPFGGSARGKRGGATGSNRRHRVCGWR